MALVTQRYFSKWKHIFVFLELYCRWNKWKGHSTLHTKNKFCYFIRLFQLCFKIFNTFCLCLFILYKQYKTSKDMCMKWPSILIYLHPLKILCIFNKTYPLLFISRIQIVRFILSFKIHFNHLRRYWVNQSV